MAEKFKKMDRRYVLSDSSVNVYGFRLLTEGYQADEFRKNPIGYYMHRREEGIALKWEDIRIEGDQITGSPVINLANARGEQTCDEIANGFLNAASVGHIVVLDYSTNPELMLPGQTGPTITKWYNKECSLVDIPGNGNALTTLYDAQENELNLADIAPQRPPIPLTDSFLQEVTTTLALGDATATAALQHLKGMVTQIETLATERDTLKADNEALQTQLADLLSAQVRAEANTLLQRAIDEKRITISLRNRLASDYATNPEGLKQLLAELPPFVSLTATLKAHHAATEQKWNWDDYDKHDPTGKKLQELRSNNPTLYHELFQAKFG